MKQPTKDSTSKGAIAHVLRTITRDGVFDRQDHLIEELPLDILLIEDATGSAVHVARMMRTPGHEIELALGFLLTQSIVEKMEDVVAIEVFPNQHSDQTIQSVTVTLTGVESKKSFQPEPMVTTTSGGMSRQQTPLIDANRDSKEAPSFTITDDVLFRLSKFLNQHQGLFESTGSSHAAAIFNASGNLEIVREDVGRHNAVDKICGCLLTNNRLPARDRGLLLSGRVSFDLIIKALVCGVQLVAAIGAPTHQATKLARRHGLSLVGFLKPNQLNIYSGSQRIKRNAK